MRTTIRRAAAVGAAGAVAAVLTAVGGTGSPEAAGPQDPGKSLFEGRGTCFACHGQDGAGTPVGPDLTDDAWLHFEGSPSVEEVLALVKEGVSKPVQYPAPMMPRGGSSLKDDELAAVARYVLTLSGTGSS